MQLSNTTAAPPPPRPARDRSRTGRLALFVAAMVWFMVAQAIAKSASNGLALRFDLHDGQPLLQAVMFLFLGVVGVALLQSMERRGVSLRVALGMPKRSTSVEEWGMGAAIGWGMAIASVLPMVLMRALSVQVWTAPRAYELLAFNLLTLAALTLAQTVVIFGFAFPRLTEALGPVRATTVLIAVVTTHVVFTPAPYDTPEGTRLLVEMLATVLLCLCWLRTHAAWLAWGVQFAWAVSMAVLFGLPLAGDSSFASVVDTRAVGPFWLTGGSYGPAAAAFSILVLIIAVPVLMSATDDYAWDYTRPEIISGGYDVTVAPPAAHVAMEEASKAPALVQIQPVALPSSKSQPE